VKNGVMMVTSRPISAASTRGASCVTCSLAVIASGAMRTDETDM
jgi:hypothetical protein